MGICANCGQDNREGAWLRSMLLRPSGYFERMTAIVEGHGGTVEKFIGDTGEVVTGTAERLATGQQVARSIQVAL